MTIDPDIRDQAYQFFIEEASELLDIIETGLLNLRPDVSVQKVHEIMRAAHSIKGGAASVDLNIIKTIAHRLENSVKALYSDTVVIDADLETLLLRAYDCLRHPLQLQIDIGTFNEKQALAVCESIFSELEERLGPALDAADSFMPSAADLGVDIVASIFEVDVAEVLAQLKDLLNHPQHYDCSQEFKAQLEVLTGFAELIELPGFIEITTLAQVAASRHSHQPLPVIEQVISDVNSVRTAILAGDRGTCGGPSEGLKALAEGEIIEPHESIHGDVLDSMDEFDLSDINLDILDATTNYGIDDPNPASLDSILSDGALSDGASLDNILSDSVLSDSILSDSTVDQVSTLEEIWSIDAIEFPSVERLEDETSLDPTVANIDALADVWGDASSPAAQSPAAQLDFEVTDFEAVMADEPSEPMLESWPPPLSPEPQLSINDTQGAAPSGADVLESGAQGGTDRGESAVSFIGDLYDSLPRLAEPEQPVEPQGKKKKKKKNPLAQAPTKPSLSAKVALDRLEQMDNLVGELAINRNSLSLQNDQFQRTVRRLGQRFSSFRTIVKQLQSISDQILVSPNQQISRELSGSAHPAFDSLELDSYGEINSLLEGVLEEVFQLAESIDDVALFAGQSNQLLERQRRTLNQLRDQLMWSRMVPLDRILKRFPRVIRELSNTYQKPVQLTLTGTDVLVDRVMLEKLYDPLLHLLRNAFDHGIEYPDARRALAKPEQGTIEIRAYHQGNYTVIEIGDDGQGLDVDKIAQRALEVGLVSPEQITAMPKQHIQQLIFEPGFSTATAVSELSGRGVGLDVVKESLQTFNGELSLATHRSKGTVFSLKIPLTLTLTKLVVGSVGTTAIALASDSIEEILRPADDQLKQSGGQCFLHWHTQLVPVYALKDLLTYQCLPPGQLPQELQVNRRGKGQQQTLLLVRQGQDMFALGLEQIVTEQELVIKPMGKAIATPSYINGCTVLADGSLVPVIDATALVQFEAGPPTHALPEHPPLGHTLTPQYGKTQTLMIVDDSSALRRTLALTLQKAGYQVLQAKDGRDALDQLQRGATPDLIICDVEMPRLNGFEFLNQRRANAVWSQIPTVMLTSRGNQKHRTLAKHLGATTYFTKPYIEKEFVGAIANLLQRTP